MPAKEIVKEKISSVWCSLITLVKWAQVFTDVGTENGN
jgi:hypothetical protein